MSIHSVEREQAHKAVTALAKYHIKVSAEREETELIDRDEHIWLIVNTKRGTTKRKLMPKRIQLPHPPMPPPPATTIAIITKPPQRVYKDLLASPQHNIKFINRVVDTDKLRGKWKPFEARRNLMRENDLWLADERIVPSLPKLLGKTFFQAKKVPIPVNLQRKDLKAELGRAINSTYFHPSTGTSHSIRISTAGITSDSDTLDNLLAAIPLVIEQIEDKWENVLSIGIKTSTSVLLPVWNSSLVGRFDVKEKAPKNDDGDVKMDGEGSSKKGKGKGKDKKRAAPEEVEEDKVEQKTKSSPAKKAKAEESKEEPAKAKVAEKKKVKAVSSGASASKADKVVGKATGKKSSSLGSGSAGKRAKEAVLGKSK